MFDDHAPCEVVVRRHAAVLGVLRVSLLNGHAARHKSLSSVLKVRTDILRHESGRNRCWFYVGPRSPWWALLSSG